MSGSFNLPCIYSDQPESFVAWFGVPAKGTNPLAAQMRWMHAYRNRYVPQEVADSFMRLLEISEENNVRFEELLDYVFAPDKKSAPAKKTLDAINLKDKVLDLTKLRKVTSENNPREQNLAKPEYTQLRRFGKSLKRPPDSLLKVGYVDTLEYCLALSHQLFSGSDNMNAAAARALFMAVAVSAVEIADPIVELLPDVLSLLVSPDLPRHLAIMLDIGGGLLSPLALGLLNQGADYPADYVLQELAPYLYVALTEFAMTLRKAKNPTPLQKAAWLALIHPELGKV